MLEVENKVITLIRQWLESKLPDENISISSDLDNIPSSFPHVSIVEGDNANYQATIDTESNEKYVESMIDINIYTDDQTGRKAHAKQIANVIDEVMIKKGFNRIAKTQIPSDDLYRLNIRYQGVVDKDFYIYRR